MIKTLSYVYKLDSKFFGFDVYFILKAGL